MFHKFGIIVVNDKDSTDGSLCYDSSYGYNDVFLADTREEADAEISTRNKDYPDVDYKVVEIKELV